MRVLLWCFKKRKIFQIKWNYTLSSRFILFTHLSRCEKISRIVHVLFFQAIHLLNTLLTVFFAFKTKCIVYWQQWHNIRQLQWNNRLFRSKRPVKCGRQQQQRQPQQSCKRVQIRFAKTNIRQQFYGRTRWVHNKHTHWYGCVIRRERIHCISNSKHNVINSTWHDRGQIAKWKLFFHPRRSVQFIIRSNGWVLFYFELEWHNRGNWWYGLVLYKIRAGGFFFVVAFLEYYMVMLL